MKLQIKATYTYLQREAVDNKSSTKLMKIQNKANYTYLQREAVDQDDKNRTQVILANKLITKALNIEQYQQMPKIIDQEFEVNFSSEVMSHCTKKNW